MEKETKTIKQDPIQVKWDAVVEKIKESQFTKTQICTLMNRSHGWLGTAKKQNNRLGAEDIEKLAMLLGCRATELIITEETEKSVPNTPTTESGEQTPNEVVARLTTLESKVDDLIAKVSKVHELLAVLSADDKQVVTGYDFMKLPRHERAKIILEGLVAEGYGKCLYSTFLADLTKNNIGSSYAEQAMKECGYQKGTVGFGKNTTTYIIDPHWEEPKREETK